MESWTLIFTENQLIRHLYLLPSSCHPPQTTENIPYSLALRIIRIRTDPVKRDKRLVELKNLLINRNYNTGLINHAIKKALSVPRSVALQPMFKSKNQMRPIFAVPYDPRHPDIPNIVKKHWRSMIYSDTYLKDVFPDPPIVAFKRQKNLRDLTIKAKIYSKTSKYQR